MPAVCIWCWQHFLWNSGWTAVATSYPEIRGSVDRSWISRVWTRARCNAYTPTYTRSWTKSAGKHLLNRRDTKAGSSGEESDVDYLICFIIRNNKTCTNCEQTETAPSKYQPILTNLSRSSPGKWWITWTTVWLRDWLACYDYYTSYLFVSSRFVMTFKGMDG